MENKTFTAAVEKFNSKLVKYFVLNILSPRSTFPDSWLPSSDPPGRELKWNICKEEGSVTFYWSASGQYICTQERTREIFYKSTRRGGEVNKIYFDETIKLLSFSYIITVSIYQLNQHKVSSCWKEKFINFIPRTAVIKLFHHSGFSHQSCINNVFKGFKQFSSI